MTSREEWQPIAGYEGFYEVSSLGRFRSVERLVPRGSGSLLVKERILRPLTSKAFPYLSISLCRDGRNRTFRAHRLVAIAFLGEPPEDTECCHINGDARDNRAANLRWGTHSSNVADTVSNGLHNQARKTHCLRGHEFTPENTYRWFNPKTQGHSRQCRTCKRHKQTH